MRAEWGLDRSWPVQYLAFAKNIFTGDLGKSFNYQMPVSTLYFQRLPASLQLALAATLISFVIGIPAGLISGGQGQQRAGTMSARSSRCSAWPCPGFWLGLVLILVFSVWLRWLPTSGTGGIAAPDHAGAGARLVFRRLAVAPDPLQHARSAAQRVHQAGAAEGPAGLRRDRDARLQERADPGADPGRHQPRRDDQRRRHHRGDLRLARHRPAALRGHLPARLPAGAGGRHAGRHHDRADQPDRSTSSTPISTPASAWPNR